MVVRRWSGDPHGGDRRRARRGRRARARRRARRVPARRAAGRPAARLGGGDRHDAAARPRPVRGVPPLPRHELASAAAPRASWPRVAQRAATSRVNVLLALREDALASLDRFKGRVPHLFDNYLRLAHLDARRGARGDRAGRSSSGTADHPRRPGGRRAGARRDGARRGHDRPRSRWAARAAGAAGGRRRRVSRRRSCSSC